MEDNFGAEDLEDGELWLPSDFFSMEEVQTSTKFNYSSSPKTKLYCMDDFDLTKRFSTFTFLAPHNPTLFKPLQILQQFKPAVRYGSTSTVVHDSCCCGTGTSMIGNPPVYQYGPLNPVDAFIGERACALHRQQQNRFAPNRARPSMGACGGTGVFLPRISGTTTPTASVGINRNRQCVRIGQGMIHKREIQVPPRKMLLNRRPNGWKY